MGLNESYIEQGCKKGTSRRKEEFHKKKKWWWKPEAQKVAAEKSTLKNEDLKLHKLVHNATKTTVSKVKYEAWDKLYI